MMNFVKTSTGLRMTVNGSTLAFEPGANLGISFIDHQDQKMKSFQLTIEEIKMLIAFLNKNCVS